MSIRRGSTYGEHRPLPDGAPVAASDAQAAEILTELRESGADPVIGLLGGDLHRTLGGLGDPRRLRGPDALMVPIDLVEAEFDGGRILFVAHLLTARPFRPDWCAVMNAEFCGDLDLAPRAHPGDGLLDIATGSVHWRERRLAARRALTGTHLPHPSLRTERVAQWSTTFDRPVPLQIDGRAHGRSRTIRVRVLPDAARVVI